MRLLAVASLVAGLLAVAVPAQARKPLLGTVVDGGGKPIAGAAVECVFAPDGPDLLPVDALTATTDARGRFRVDALPGALYQCWAAGPADADGVQLVSAIAPAAVGQLPALVAKTKSGTSAVTLRGLDAWQDRAPFTLRCLVAGRQLAAKVEVVDGGFVASVGARPLGGVEAEVRDRDGLTVVRSRLAPRATRLTVPPPQPARLRVVDDKGQPVAGARVVRVRDRARISVAAPDRQIGLTAPDEVHSGGAFLGTAGNDGIANVRIAWAHDPFGPKAKVELESLCLRVDAPGRGASYGGRDYQSLVENGKEAEEKERDGLLLSLPVAKPWRGRLVDGGKPLAGVGVVAKFEVAIEGQQGWTREWHDQMRAVTDADGRFRFDAMPANAKNIDLAYAIGADRLPPPATAAPLAARPVFAHPIAARGDGDDDVLVDVTALATVELTVRDEGGGMGRGLQLGIISGECESADRSSLRLLAPDASGRIAVKVPPGNWVVVACTESGYVAKEFDAATTPTLELKVEPFPTMRARIVDTDGKPVAGAGFRVSAQQWVAGESDTLVDILRDLAMAWNDELLRRARSDADGVVRVGFVVDSGSHATGTFYARGMSSAALELVAEDLGDVVVQ
ncbi:MAG: carboxypeptidase regulatory-like domain-containing protein [Planctomycetes bacterium]|nr:carboxypeptidase regulatory-like domain-containing protein [Planctomycetota bacterium]